MDQVLPKIDISGIQGIYKVLIGNLLTEE